MDLFKKSRIKFFFVFAIIVSASFLVAHSLFAQVNTGLEFAAQAGLATTDIRLTIARLIRAVMGFLGVVAVLIILYGGFIYATAAGNEEKISKAKKILIGGLIGLLITLSAFGIAQFTLSQLMEATGVPAGPPGPGGGGGVIPSEAFKINSISPQGEIPIRNVIVRIVFNRNVDPETVTIQGNVTVKKTSDNSLVDGTLTTSGTVVQFEPNTACPAPNADRKCFEGDTEFVVEVANGPSGVKSIEGKELTCGLGGAYCEAYFRTGNLVDVAPPEITITSPYNGEQVSADAFIPIEAHVTDDGGVAMIEFYVDNNLVGVDAPAGTPSPTIYDALFNWDTTGLTLGSTHSLKAKAYDIDNNNKESNTVNVLIRAAHCFNQTQDADETGKDCGGADCGACSGGSCERNEDCASGFCDPGTKTCLELPVITWVDPNNGASGNIITIFGQSFGSEAGEVVFLGGDTDNNGNPAGDADDKKISTAPSGCGNLDWWKDNQIVVEIPEGAIDGPIQVTTSKNLYDRTNDERGIKLDFDVNNKIRPGLCALDPLSGQFETKVKLTGKNFGTTKGGVEFGLVPASSIGDWKATTISDAAVPNINPGIVKTQVVVGGEYSNSLNFEMKQAPNLPHIDYLNPTSGPRGQYVTIYGRNFGSEVGSVYFKLAADTGPGLGTIADTTFPQACALNYWTDSHITVKAPNVTDIGGYKIKVVRKDNAESNTADFSIRTGSPGPGICRIEPDNGPAQTPLTIFGEKFGNYTPPPDGESKVKFWQEKIAPLASPNDWQEGEIKTTVPFGALTGPVDVIDQNGTKSNDYNFRVGQCPKDFSCYSDEDCCTDGACKPKGGCPVVAPNISHYAWPFKTGAAFYGVIPKVIERDCPASRAQNGAMSPNPWSNTKDNCSEAFISAKFNTNMMDSSLVSGTPDREGWYSSFPNIIIKKCNLGETFSQNACQNNVLGKIKITAQGSEEEGFIFKPEANFSLNTWYEVTLKSGPYGIKSDTGLMLDGNGDGEEGGNYVWAFRIKSEPGACAIDYISVEPENKVTLKHVAETQNYDSMPFAANCNLLNPESYDWLWSSLLENGAAGDSIATISQNKSTKTNWVLPWQVATAQEQSGDVFITAEAKDTGGKKDNSPLEVNLNLPFIDSISPENGIAESYATTYITISGGNFGATKGKSKVLIGGYEAQIACDQWYDREIIAIVPAGVGGNLTLECKNDPSDPSCPHVPVQVITSGGESNKVDFTINNIIRPNICRIIPNFGKTGDTPKIEGNDFGDTQDSSGGCLLGGVIKSEYKTKETCQGAGGSWLPPGFYHTLVKYGLPIMAVAKEVTEIKDWNNMTIVGQVPETQSGDVKVFLPDFSDIDKNNNRQEQIIDSNPVKFTMRPYITRLSPEKGPKETWVTIFGGNFGNPWCSNPNYKNKTDCEANGGTWNVGKVYFYKSGGATVTKGDVTANNLIEAELAPCAGAWSDTQIVAVVPEGAESGLARVETNLPLPFVSLITKEEDSKSFTVNQDPLGPGICELDPNKGQVGIQVKVKGDRFEETPREGKLIFFPNQVINYPAGGWSNNLITANVPALTMTGPVKVTKTLTLITGRKCTGIPFLGFCVGGDWVEITEDRMVESNEVNFTVAPNLSCTTDADCYGSCPGSRCIIGQGEKTGYCSPVIQSFSPTAGAQGTWVTINGCDFGNLQGEVWFTGLSGRYTIKGIWPNPVICGNNTWFNGQIIVEVPNIGTLPNLNYPPPSGQTYDPLDAIDGPIKICRPHPENGKIDCSDRGNIATTAPSAFDVNTQILPAICKVDPQAGYAGETAVVVSGKNFGEEKAASDSLKFDDKKVVSFLTTPGCPALDGWSENKICGLVPPDLSPTRTCFNEVLEEGTYGSDLTNKDFTISGGTYQSGFEPAKAFDNLTNTTISAWRSLSTYIGQDFGAGNAKNIRKVRIYGSSYSYGFNAKFQYSDDGAVWKDTNLNISVPNGGEWKEFEVNDFGSHRYWRFLDNQAQYAFQANEIEMFALAAVTVACQNADGCDCQVGGITRCRIPQGQTSCSYEDLSKVRVFKNNQSSNPADFRVLEKVIPPGPYCGNGKAEAGEQCDGSDFSMSDDVCKLCGADFTASVCGAPETSEACQVTACTNPEGKVCRFICHNFNAQSGTRECWVDLNNDGVVDDNEYGTPLKVGEVWKCRLGGKDYDNFNGVEQCDDKDFDGLSCANWGQPQGSLSCESGCKINNSGCFVPQVVEDESCTSNTQSPTPWKDSTDACLNGLISARFNMDMDDETLLAKEKEANMPLNIKVKACNAGENVEFDPGACQTEVGGALSIINHNTSSEGFVFTPSTNLAPNTWYQVTISKSVKSSGGIEMINDYQWKFKTSNQTCSVDHLLVVPPEQTLLITGLIPHPTQDYSAWPTAANCNLLNPATYSYVWRSTTPEVATVGGDIDNTTTATAQAEGTTNIEATIPAENKSDYGVLTVSRAEAPIVETCRPTADTLPPITCESGATNVCLNAVVEITFSQVMDENSFDLVPLDSNNPTWPKKSNNIYLEACSSNGCSLTPTTILSKVKDNKTVVSLIPTSFLNPSQLYKVTVKDGEGGVKSLIGAMKLSNLNTDTNNDETNDAFSWTFTTSQAGSATTYCKVSKVEVTILPPGKVKNRDLFNCAGDNCRNDQSTGEGALAGNQHEYTADAYDKEGQPVQAIYTWLDDPQLDPQNGVVISDLSGTEGETITRQQIYVTSQIVENAQATLKVGALGLCEGEGCDAGYAEASVRIIVFLCQNPWPGWDSFPYQDSSENCGAQGGRCVNSNFSTYYCRDFGEANRTDDDLPALNPVVVLGKPGSDLFKEFLFPRDTTPPTDNSSDVIGIRILKNIDHLPPLEWYLRNVPRPASPSQTTLDGYEAVQDDRTIYVNAANLTGYCGKINKEKKCRSNSDCSAGESCYLGNCATGTQTVCSQNEDCPSSTPDCLLSASFYTNIYLISYNEGANQATQNIYKQMMNNWRFNANLEILETKGQLTRDTKRLQDLNIIATLLEEYRRIHGKYPTLEAGTYEKGETLSIWPSWQAVLGNALGTTLPYDPLNKLGTTSPIPITACPSPIPSNYHQCPNDKGCCGPIVIDGQTYSGQCFESSPGVYECSACPLGFDPITCWSEKEKRFAYP